MTNVISSEYVKTKKEHSCSGCLRKFPAKIILMRHTCTESNKIYSYYLCPVCEEYIAMHFEPNDMFVDGGVRDGDVEEWERIRQEVEGGANND